jgi:cell division transport system ATP-binding protein
MIEFEAMGFRYGDRPVFEEVSLTLEAGSLHFLTGRSGAGKSTLLRLIHGGLRPQRGAARVFGDDTRTLSRRARARMRRRLGLVLQEGDLLEHLTVAENVALPLRIAGEDLTGRAGDVAELIEWVGMAERAQARPPQLSSGERRRAAVARAVVAGPELILADEPTGDLDPEAAERVMRLFLELNRIGRTVLIATHDLAMVRRAGGAASARTLRIAERAVRRAGADL